MIHNLPEQGKDLRKEISEILVKWSMPTRQVAISEIVSLIRQAKLERTEEIREYLGKIATEIYPEDVFIPLPNGGKEIFAAIHQFLKEKFGGTIDAVSADYARRNIKMVKEEIERNFPSHLTSNQEL